MQTAVLLILLLTQKPDPLAFQVLGGEPAPSMEVCLAKKAELVEKFPDKEFQCIEIVISKEAKKPAPGFKEL